jgi:hypothetical protein
VDGFGLSGFGAAEAAGSRSRVSLAYSASDLVTTSASGLGTRPSPRVKAASAGAYWPPDSLTSSHIVTPSAPIAAAGSHGVRFAAARTWAVQVRGRNWAMPCSPPGPSRLGSKPEVAMICAAIRAGGISGQTFPAASTAFTYGPGTGTTAPPAVVAGAGDAGAPPNAGCRAYQVAYRSAVST